VSHPHGIHANLLKRESTQPPVALPADLKELATFLRRADSFGSNIAFWRGKTRSKLLQSVIFTLRSYLIGFDGDQYTPQQAEALLTTFTRILEHLNRIVESIPFRNKVGFLRRNLISTFQQVYILRHLCQAIVCRLRPLLPDAAPGLPAGTLLDREARSALRASMEFVGSAWDRESWNVYDYL